MITTTIKINKNIFSKLPARFETQIAFIIINTVQVIAAHARANAPVVSGALRDGIHSQVFNRLKAIAYSSVGYSGFVEYGTATRVSGDAPPGYTVSRSAYDIFPVNTKALHFIGKDGKDVFVNAIYGHPGIYPHPFFMPACEYGNQFFLSELAQLGDRLDSPRD